MFGWILSLAIEKNFLKHYITFTYVYTFTHYFFHRCNSVILNEELTFLFRMFTIYTRVQQKIKTHFKISRDTYLMCSFYMG